MSAAPVFLPTGELAVMVQLPSLTEVLSLQAQLMAAPDPEQVDVVAAAETVLVTVGSPQAVRRLKARILATDRSPVPPLPDAVVVIDTMYDGDDLAEAAAVAGLSVDGLVRMHSGQLWVAAFGGFAPGFAYLLPEDGAPPMPRRSSPRPVVPAGSVALAGNYSAIYPGASPGGWQLIGRTDAALWDPQRKSPALIQPGNRVRFRPVRELVALAGEEPGPTRTGEAPPARDGRLGDGGTGTGGKGITERCVGAGIVVVAPGLQTTVQDLGRPGFAHLGVPGSGALDRAALRRANRLVGNDAGAAALEAVLGGLSIEAVEDQVMAVSGASTRLTVSTAGGGERLPALDAPFVLLRGERLTLGPLDSGLRSYVAFRGGLIMDAVLGSRATDILSGTGPAALAAGDRLTVGPTSNLNAVGIAETSPPPPPQVTTFHFRPGPRRDWFTHESLAAFQQQIWEVAPVSNRVGLRLSGSPLERARGGELASEGAVLGSVQIPPNGQPVLFLADHPVTGGYPVIAVVDVADLDRAAQLPPGAKVVFRAHK